jgi:hypothetical protein
MPIGMNKVSRSSKKPIVIPDSEDLYARVENQYLIDNYSDTDSINQWDGNVQNASLSQSTTDDQPTFDADGANGVGAASFDGSNDSLAATGLNTLDETDGFTAFIYLSAPSQSGYGGVIGPVAVETDEYDIWLIRRNNSDIYEASVDGTFTSSVSASNVEDGSRHSLIFSVTGGTANFYLDGSSVGGATDVSGYSFSSSSLRLGEYTTTNNYYHSQKLAFIALVKTHRQFRIYIITLIVNTDLVSRYCN